MKFIGMLSIIIAFIHVSPLSAATNVDSWGHIFYTQYESSKIYYAPLTQSAVQGILYANETVKADFKQGKWFAVFKPSETIRSINNAVGYMEEADLFSDPLPVEYNDEVENYVLPVRSSIEKMSPIQVHSRKSSSTQNTQVIAQVAPISTVTWSEITSIYGASSRLTDLQKDEIWKKYKGQRVQWTGKVKMISYSEGLFGSFTLSVDMGQGFLQSSPLVFLNRDQKDIALEFKRGDFITFRGTLSDWGTTMSTVLKDGEIVITENHK